MLRHLKKTIIAVALVSCLTALTMVPAAHADDAPSQTFSESGTFTVPEGVTLITVYATGSSGSYADCSNFDGVRGQGGVAGADFEVTPGQVFKVHINDDGGTAGNYGGRGGDSSDIRFGGDALSNRILVGAGGGGSACGVNSAMKGGDGGNAVGTVGEGGQDGYAVSEPVALPDSISPQIDDTRGYGGGGGTQSAAGIGGNGTVDGTAGGTPAQNNGGNSTAGDNAGGAGGGGYYGGGAGATEPDSAGSGGGGGGAGSSFIDESAVDGGFFLNNDDQPQEVFFTWSASEETTTTTTTTAVPGPSGAYGSKLSDTTTSLVASPGGDVTVHGKGFAPDSDVTVTLHSAPVLLGTAHTNSQGAFVKTFVLPKGTALGKHEIILAGVDSNGDPATATLDLTVASLANTGANPANTMLFAFGLVLLGGMTAALARRRVLRAL